MAAQLDPKVVYAPVMDHITTLYADLSKHRTPQTDGPHLFDAILYINLAHRTDRVKILQSTLKLLAPYAKEVVRVDAVQHAQGGKGCALSHIKVFELIKQKGYVTTLVLEDDATLDEEPKILAAKFRDLFQREDYDCIVCGAHPAPFTGNPNDSYRRITPEFHEPTVGYVIHIDYVPILQSMWQFCIDGLSDDKMDVPWANSNYAMYAIDQAWRKLFPIHNWFWIEDNVIRQACSISDITREVHRKYPPYHLSAERRQALGLPIDPNKTSDEY